LHSYSGDLDHKITLSEAMHKFTKENPQLLVHGGRTRAIQRMRLALLYQDHYDHRDILTYSTTFLSAYIKFGCISIREVYHKLRNKYGLSSGIVRQLLWREYYAHVLFAYPQVIGQSYQPAFRKIKWSNSEKRFELWKRGQTGFPIVDAGMRQMNTTGYMHNRVRMMTASFLIKVLHIDWRWGEKYFAQKLTDYDVANNNGNWQEISGTGVDMKPYFRDMSPWVQSIKFDSKAEYIKKWVPELKEVDPMDIHKWYDSWSKYKDIEYPKPMVDYHEEREKMLKMYKDAL
jgi:deoxyribodipyrimidine photo-lyase